jgi:hypothetical protein
MDSPKDVAGFKTLGGVAEAMQMNDARSMCRMSARVLVFAVLLVGCSVGAQGHVQDSPAIQLTSDQADAIIDLVFARPHYDASHFRYQMTLRFFPHQLPEQQVLINVDNNATVEVWLTTVAGRGTRDVVDSYLRSHKAIDVHAIANLIPVKTQRLMVSPELGPSWYSGCVAALKASADELEERMQVRARTGAVTVVLHGASYDLRVEQADGQIHWHFDDVQIDDSAPAGNLSLAKWMNAVRRAVLQQVAR